MCSLAKAASFSSADIFMKSFWSPPSAAFHNASADDPARPLFLDRPVCQSSLRFSPRLASAQTACRRCKARILGSMLSFCEASSFSIGADGNHEIAQAAQRKAMKVRSGCSLLRRRPLPLWSCCRLWRRRPTRPAASSSRLFQHQRQLAGEFSVTRQGVVAQQHLRQSVLPVRQRTSTLGSLSRVRNCSFE